MHGRGACMVGIMCGRGDHAWHASPSRYYEIWSMSGQYTSYWNTFLFLIFSLHGVKFAAFCCIGYDSFSVTCVKCGIRSTLCWKISNISGSIELFGL